MKQLADQLPDVLGPVRDFYVSALLEALATELDGGADVDPEPVDRDVDGRVRRRTPLNLPMRHDLRVRRAGRTALRGVPGVSGLRFAPVSGPITETVAARIAPFSWGAVEIVTRCAVSAPNWTPLRLWFLEWFQARYGEESPDLLGVAHRVEGPAPTQGGWRFTVDLGSASAPCFMAMLDAFGRAGCAEIRIGETETAL
ncbi:MAG: hypothetical protein EA355_00465 [Rhodobacteraceae bacterium]|nr:MAG: hypothetical protein EA355_00465 [Paracoccaceae bacterium]